MFKGKAELHITSLKKFNRCNSMQIFITAKLLTCFGRPSRPTSAVHKTVVAASGTDHTIWGASNKDWFGTVSPKPVLVWSRLKKLAPQIVLSVPEAATTVLCTADDGRDGRPKHVQ